MICKNEYLLPAREDKPPNATPNVCLDYRGLADQIS